VVHRFMDTRGGSRDDRLVDCNSLCCALGGPACFFLKFLKRALKLLESGLKTLHCLARQRYVGTVSALALNLLNRLFTINVDDNDHAHLGARRNDAAKFEGISRQGR
jgi:hypothetical protein